MARKTRKRKDTVWIPKTIHAAKKLRTRTMKRGRFLLNQSRRRIIKVPSYLDKVASRTIRRLFRR
jgi:hypothetical protein